MFDNEPLTPSEAVTDIPPDPTELTHALDRWVQLKQQLIDDCFGFAYPGSQAVISRVFQQLVRVCYECVGDGKPHARPRPRNSRVQRVQAKRKHLGLSQDGKCCGFRSRKASYAFRQAEERFYQQGHHEWTPGGPSARDYEHVPARRRKREARRQLRWKALAYNDQELAWIEAIHANTCEICAAFGISEKFLTGELSTFDVDNSLDDESIPFYATQESEQSNG